MTHRYKKPQPSTRMYRHFAVVTLGVTGLIAFFADDGGSQPVPQRIGQPQAQPQMPAEAHRQVVSPPQQPSGVWGSADGDSEAPASADSNVAGSSAMTSGQSADENTAEAENIAGVEAQRSSLEAASRARSGSLGRQ